MKVVGYSKQDLPKRKIVAPIPLIHPERKIRGKDEYCTFKLRTNPNEVGNLSEYERHIPYFSTGTPEEWLITVCDLNKVIAGQRLGNGPAKFTLARQVLQGDALSTFNTQAEVFETEAHMNCVEGHPVPESQTTANYNACIMAVTKHVFPHRALSMQKRYMRRYLRKPRDMSVRDFVARLQELNGYLSSFPPEGTMQGEPLPDDVLKEILEFGIPSSWLSAMDITGFSPMTHTMTEFIECCERCERNEPSEEARTATASTVTKKRRTAESSRKTSTYSCVYHGENRSHDTADCKVIQYEVKKLKASRSNSGNHDSQKKQSYASKKKNGPVDAHNIDFKALINDAVNDLFEKKAISMVNHEDKKRKASDDATAHVRDTFNLEQDIKHFGLNSDNETETEDEGASI